MCIIEREEANTFYFRYWNKIPRQEKDSMNTKKLYRVIHKSLRDFRNRLRNNQDRHGRKEHINR